MPFQFGSECCFWFKYKSFLQNSILFDQVFDHAVLAREDFEEYNDSGNDQRIGFDNGMSLPKGSFDFVDEPKLDEAMDLSERLLSAMCYNVYVC